jgi:hypothetical protein
MAIEIRELVIRAVVGSGGERRAPAPAPDQDRWQQEMVAECVEQVLDVLRLKQER